MTNRVLVDAAAFMDSTYAQSLKQTPTTDVRTIVQSFLSACYDDVGKAPRLLDGDELSNLLHEVLPRHFGTRDPLASAVKAVLTAYLVYLRDNELVPNAYELDRALDENAHLFVEAVRTGAAHANGIAATAHRPRVHRGTRVGRNDPCPCGSGKKFKKCCQRIGE